MCISSLTAQISELQKGSGEAEALSFEERADRLNELFTEKVVPFLRQVNAAAIKAQVEEQLYY